MFSYIWPWLQKPSCVCADSAACQRVTRLLSCVVTGFADLHAQQPGDLKTRGEGGWRRGEGAGRLPIIWCCLSCIIPRFQMEGNCWWSRRAEQLKTERERERGGEEKEERPALFFGVSMQTPDKASLPLFTKFVFFPGSRFDRLSILMESCDAPKLCLNPSRNSQQLRPLLICNFCRAPVEKPKGYE